MPTNEESGTVKLCMTLEVSVDGIYSAYLTGIAGSGIAMITLKNGVLVGADVSGILFDGQYRNVSDGYRGFITVSVPGGGQLIQGVTAPPQGLNYEVPIHFPPDFLERPFITITTPYGAVNCRLVKLRSL
jgi:hypothetical protein